MSQPQDQMPKRFVSFIQSIPLKLRSGLQTPKLAQRANIETGSIAFAHGQATETKVLQSIRSETFNQMTPWNTGQFSFTTHHSLPTPHFRPIYTNTRGNSPVAGQPAISRHTQPLIHEPDRRKGSQTQPLAPHLPSTSVQTYPNVNINFKGAEIPQPSRSFHTALQLMELMNFSRAHRRLFLLIDGKRSINELARLMGYTPEEVSKLLRHLENANLF